MSDAVPVVLVDFDLTLIDSTADLVDLTRRTLAAWQLRASQAAIEELLGLPTIERLRRHGVPTPALEQAAAHFLALHTACDYRRSWLMSGAARWLDATPCLPKWVVSASPLPAVLAGLRYHSVADCFDRVLGAPAAGCMNKIAALAPHRVRFMAAGCWVLGDQRSDQAAAASIGARFALMRNARNGDLAPLADRILANFDELLVTPLEDTWTRSM